MNIQRALLLCALLAVSCGRVLADTVAVEQLVGGKDTLTVLDREKFDAGGFDDPQIMVRRLRRGSVQFQGPSFSFWSQTGSGIFDFFSDNNFRLAELVFTITPGGPSRTTNSLFGCGVGSEYQVLPFSQCQFDQFGDEGSPTVVTFSRPGLPAFSHFAVELTGFPANAHIAATATPAAATPEPGTLVLLLAGTGAVLSRRKRSSGLGLRA